MLETLRKKIAGALIGGAVQKYTDQDPLAGTFRSVWGNGAIHNANDYSEIIREAYKLNGTVAACAKLLSFALAQTPLAVRDKYGDIRKDHPAIAVFRSPQPQVTRFEYFENLIYDLYGAGVYYNLIYRIGKKVKYLQRVKPNTVEPIAANAEEREKGLIIGGYKIAITGGGHKLIPSSDMLAIRFSDPGNNLGGLSPLTPIFENILLDNHAKKYIRTVLENKGMAPGLIAFTERMDPVESRRLVNDFKNKFSGEHRGELAIIAGMGMKDLKELGISFKELALETIRAMPQIEICNAFGVPPESLPILAGLNNSSYANKQQAQEDFQFNTVEPLECKLSETYTMVLLSPGSEDTVVFDSSNVSAVRNIRDKGRQTTMAEVTGGTRTIDEGRAAIGLPPIEGGGGDFFIRTSAQILVPNGAYVPPPPPPPEKTPPPDVPKSTGGKKSTAPCSCGDKHPAGTVTKELPTEAVNTLTDAEKKRVATASYDLAMSFEPQWIAEFERIFEGQRDDVFKALKAIHKKADLPTPQEYDDMGEQLSLMYGQWSAKISDKYQEMGMTLVKTAADQAISGGIGLDIDISNDDVREFVRGYSYTLGDKIATESASQLRDIMLESQNNKLSIFELRQTLTDTFKDWTGNRAELVAVTETHLALNSGDKIAYTKAGVTEMEWYATLDDTCPICLSLHGTIVSTGEPWVALGDTIELNNGKTFTNKYRDIDSAHAHPRCRCKLVPVFREV